MAETISHDARWGEYPGEEWSDAMVQPPDFAKLAEAGNSYGETVREPEEVAPALQRGLDQVRKGTPALIAAYLPTLVEEMKMRHGM